MFCIKFYSTHEHTKEMGEAISIGINVAMVAGPIIGGGAGAVSKLDKLKDTLNKLKKENDRVKTVIENINVQSAGIKAELQELKTSSYFNYLDYKSQIAEVMKDLEEKRNRMSSWTVALVVCVNITLFLKMAGIIDALNDGFFGKKYYRPALVRCHRKDRVEGDIDSYLNAMNE